MATTSPVDHHAIVVRDGIPILMRIYADEERKTVLVPEVEQPSQESLNAMIEAQGGRFTPHGIFRYDPLLASSGIKNCADCGAIWQVRGYCTDPAFKPKKCPRCQAPYRGPDDKKTL